MTIFNWPGNLLGVGAMAGGYQDVDLTVPGWTALEVQRYLEKHGVSVLRATATETHGEMLVSCKPGDRARKLIDKLRNSAAAAPKRMPSQTIEGPSISIGPLTAESGKVRGG
jgi:hypothetical protein